MVEAKPWVEVLVDSSYAQGLFTYAIPPGLTVNPGDIVTVNFGSQQLGAIAIRLLPHIPSSLDPERIKPIEGIVAQGFFSPNYWQLLLQVADYYQADTMAVIKAALPPGLLRRSQTRIRLRQTSFTTKERQALSPAATAILDRLEQGSAAGYTTKYLKRQIKAAQIGIQELRKYGLIEQYLQTPPSTKVQHRKSVSVLSHQSELSKRQQEILSVLQHHGGEMWLDELVAVGKTTAATLDKMEKVGAVAIATQEKLRLHKLANQDRDQIKSLTTSQKTALQQITQIDGYGEVLLHGVTGSGKTEVYLQAIAHILTQQKSALVLVPEIGLTPQLLDRFTARFGDKVLVYHSGLSAGERFDTWRQMLMPVSQIVIGTRSAIFAPLPNLGMIILDEEHDSSYKQDQKSPHYHARTIAQWRAHQEYCPLILGSATPSLDTWRQFQTTKLQHHYLSLPERIQARPLPPVEIVDMRQELRRKNFSLFSKTLRNALGELKETKGQGILFVARRGHSTFVSCRSCGYKMCCPYCDVTLSYHYVKEGSAQTLRCHYCNHSQLQPSHCPDCGSSLFKFFGNGTQKVIQSIRDEFPELRCLRFDSDTTRRKGAHRDLLGQFARGEADILLGTQMLTKGLDVAQVTLVGILAADGLLFQSDFRAAERTFQTLVQVAGRAGRGDRPGKVILQTYSPDDPVIQAVKDHNYKNFATQILAEREMLNYPPFGKLVLIRLTGENHDVVQKTTEAIAAACNKILDIDDELLGPVPANIARIANRWRWQVVLKFSPDKTKIPELRHLQELCPRQVGFSINVDPVYLD
ncbi:replication restart DNA helicase PriA [[Leptolyngbya] sp. PCC 7376]|uniref:primosomal protein N' n=1 Tax=[Leptolyngbya] sp. PCC 7376 TaxID=111781 RepID=UPI00029ED9F8|nr:primosomal protein N' [[Leptolyngbya] sp. PCC 7376]AFY39427.1 replication restart DNA helicase PriA [[Leptolyngbya] sp. PCC 7376]